MTTNRTTDAVGMRREPTWPRVTASASPSSASTRYGLVAPRTPSRSGMQVLSEVPDHDRTSLLLPHGVTAQALRLREYASQSSPFLLLAACVASLAYAVTVRMVDPVPVLRVAERRAVSAAAARVQPLPLSAANAKPSPLSLDKPLAGAIAAVVPAAPARVVVPELHRRAATHKQAKAPAELAKPDPEAAPATEPSSDLPAAQAEPAQQPVETPLIAAAEAQPSTLPLPGWLVRAGARAAVEAKPVRRPVPSVRPVQRRIVASVELLQVRGALPASVVKRGLSRLESQYQHCGELSSGVEQSRFQLRAVIDETGHGREAHADGPQQPELQRCIERVTAGLVVAPPDTGVARVQATLSFSSVQGN